MVLLAMASTLIISIGKIDVYFSHRLYTDLAQLDEVMESKTLP
jgi:hypothetical protein